MISSERQEQEEALLAGDLTMLPDELEVRARMQNLMWTVAGDYKLDTKLDTESFRRSRYVSMYDAVRQGAFARFFDRDAFAVYILKKVYCGADQIALTNLGQMCVETAAYPRILEERPGTVEIRRKAFDYLLSSRFDSLSNSLSGKIKLALMKGVLTGSWDCEGRIRRPLDLIRSLENATDTAELIRVLDELYNTVIDPHFVRDHGDLNYVLTVTLEDLKEFDWKDLLEEEAGETDLETIIQKLSDQMSVFEEAETEEVREKKKAKRTIVLVDEEAAAKMDRYIELNFGRSYLREGEARMLNYRLCRGAHADCKLYYTDGIFENHVISNAQYVTAARQIRNNQNALKENASVVARNVELMSAYLKRMMLMRTQIDEYRSDHGRVDANRLWRVGRVEDPGKLFYAQTRQRSNEFAVEILIDASGSQRGRQSAVALQAYITSRALSKAGIPHRIMSFCTFWDYTVMQRFRDYDDPPERDAKVLELTTSSNNRDGLAFRAAGDSLLGRSEENRILIVLSDGKPNDVVVGRPGSRNPKPYAGDYAVQDTAFEVRKLRGQGVLVLGVFTGKEQDLSAEKKIFGKDFAYIRDIRNFSRVVTAYLGRLLDTEDA